MEFKYLTTTKCPICGCSIVIKEDLATTNRGKEIMSHVNGGEWEQRTFLCGQRVDYIPNFSKDVPSEYYWCRRDPEIIKRKKLQKRAKEILIDQIVDLGLEEKDRKDLKYQIERFGT